MILKKWLIGFLSAVTALTCFVRTAYAAPITMLEPLKASCKTINPGPYAFIDYFNCGMQWLVNVCVGIATLWVLIAAGMYILSFGDPGKQGAARGHIISALIGLVLLVFFGAFLRMLNSIFFG